MVSASFPQSTHALSRPADMTDEECDPLSVANCVGPDGIPYIVSCWKLTKEELEEFNRTGRIWLFVVGTSMPPVALSAKSPFHGE